VEIDGEPLMDGSFAANTLMRLAAEFGAEPIIVLRSERAVRRVVGKALHAITLMIAWQLRHELETVPQSGAALRTRGSGAALSLWGKAVHIWAGAYLQLEDAAPPNAAVVQI
jgi:hypothetical protein